MRNHFTTNGPIADATAIDRSSLPRVTTATLVGFARTGAPLLDIPGDPTCMRVPARSCLILAVGDVGKQVVILRDTDNTDEPIVIGVIQPAARRTPVEITADGHGISVRADESIVLRCGEASITLNRDGKVVIRGKHVVTHASGVNRIRGGSVELN